MRVLSINFGDQGCASSLYRIWQLQKPLLEHGIELHPVEARVFRSGLKPEDYDLVIVQKKLFATNLIRELRRKAKRLVYDIDDALWAPHGRRHHFLTRLRTVQRLKAICRAADLCLTANDVIAAKLRSWGANVTVFPMALDEKVWFPGPRKAKAKLRIGWAGGPANLPYLQEIADVFTNLNAELAVFCGDRPEFLNNLDFTHIPYDPREESEAVRTFDIGLVPLPDNEFAAAKSPIKAIQYMACAVAPVVSDVGATRSMFVEGKSALFARTKAEWANGLQRLIDDEQLRIRLGEEARKTFEANHRLGNQVPKLAQILKDVKSLNR